MFPTYIKGVPRKVFSKRGPCFEGNIVILWLLSSKESENEAGTIMLQRIYESSCHFFKLFLL